MVLKLKNKLSKKIFIKTFGCQMNEYDSNRILDLVKTVGFIQTKNILEADCYILNTCHIREKAKDKVYHDVGRLKKEFRERKKPILIVTGCVAASVSLTDLFLRYLASLRLSFSSSVNAIVISDSSFLVTYFFLHRGLSCFLGL